MGQWGGGEGTEGAEKEGFVKTSNFPTRMSRKDGIHKNQKAGRSISVDER